MNKLFCLFLSAAVMSLQGQMTLVENGKARTAIVIPDRPQPCHELAAEELVHHVRKASGAVLEVFRESEAPTGFDGLIYLGNCQASVNAGIAVSAMKPSHFAVEFRGAIFSSMERTAWCAAVSGVHGLQTGRGLCTESMIFSGKNLASAGFFPVILAKWFLVKAL